MNQRVVERFLLRIRSVSRKIWIESQICDGMTRFKDWLGDDPDEGRFLRRILDHVSDCLVVVDTDGRVVLINQPYCRLLGGRAEDFIGRHITEVVSPETRLHKVAQGKEVVLAAPLVVRGHRLITKQVPVFQDGEVVGAVGLALFRDVGAGQEGGSSSPLTAPSSETALALEKGASEWRARHSIGDILGQGRQIGLLRTRIQQAADHAHTVLLEGETGTGKELAAHAIHNLSKRASRPFVWVNCASIPAQLIDAELFGYEGGAFTGARPRGHRGKFETAHTGTLFLDEIGDMPFELQASLLRVVQSQQVVRVGGSAQVSVDVRLICATNRPLTQLMLEGRFRADLYYRLNVFPIRLPPLRERDDVRFLVDTLLERFAKRERLPFRCLSAAMMETVLAHRWPGNFRELESVLLRFLYTGEVDAPARPASELAALRIPRGSTPGLRTRLFHAKRHAIEEALHAASQDKDAAARLLGISRASLYRDLQRMKEDVTDR